jgi:nitroreductase
MDRLEMKNENFVYKTIISRRSIRRFKQEKIPIDILKKCVNSARLAPSAANLQPLEYIILKDEEKCNKLFEMIGFAGYLPDWNPSLDEKPMAYIIILCSDQKNKWYFRDASFAAENIILTAESYDIGSCVLCNIKKEKIKKLLKIPDEIIVDSVVALGYKNEQPKIVDYKDSVKYYHDKTMVLNVPKKPFEQLCHIDRYKK